MAHRTRHLAAALGPHSDYFYDKTFKPGAAARRSRKRDAGLVNRRARQLTKRETQRIVDSER